MLISVQVHISCTSMHGHWQTLCVESRIVSSICTSCNETREDSRTLSRLACTNPSRAIRSLAYGMRVLTRASNKIKQHTRENYTSCKLGRELYRTFHCFLSQLDTCLRFLNRLAIPWARFRQFGKL